MFNVKELLMKVVDRSSLLRTLFTYYKCSQSREFLNEINRRAKLSIFDYKELGKELHEYPCFFIPDCNYYGLYHNLLVYSGLQPEHLTVFQKHYFYIEHGLVLGSYVNCYNIGKAKLVTTISPVRQKIIDSTIEGVHSHVIGPYIHYCESLLTIAEIAAKKLDLGKVLLVIPSHSIGSVTAEFDEESFVAAIRKKRNGFDTVIVCLYWKDIDNGSDKIYLNEGFQVSTAGHRDDLNFLPRLKSLFLLASEVYTNSIGTHIAYSLDLHIPITIYEQQVVYKQVQDFQVNREILEKEDNIRTADSDRQIIIDSVHRDNRAVLNQYFGLDRVKSPEEMRKLLLSNR